MKYSIRNIYISLVICTLSILTVSLQGAKLTLSMVVRNEANRYLRQVLQSAKAYIDEAVIVDDASTDTTVEICLQVLDGIPVHIIQNSVSRFSNEVLLRKQQWEETLKTNPEWILCLDADEILEDRAISELPKLLNSATYDVYCLRLYDFWDNDHYREDTYWRAHCSYRPFLVRFRKDFVYTWQEIPLHCGRFPCNIFVLPNRIIDLRVKHYGWARAEDRIIKYQRYKQLDPQGTWGNKAQYESILDQNPILVRWVE